MEVAAEAGLFEATERRARVVPVVGVDPHGARLDSAREAVRLAPLYAKGHWVLASLLVQRHEYMAGMECYRRAISLSPLPHHEISLDLAWLLATAPDDALRDGAEAERLAMDVFTTTGERSIRALDALGAALAEQGQYGDALIRLEQALSLAAEGERDAPPKELEQASGLSGWGPAADTAMLLQRRRLYAKGQPFRTAPGGGRE